MASVPAPSTWPSASPRKSSSARIAITVAVAERSPGALARTLSYTGPPALWATSKREPADQVTGDERESHGLHGMLGDVLACDVYCLVQHSHGALRLNSRARLRRERSPVCTLSHRLSGARTDPGIGFYFTAPVQSP